MKPDPSLKEPAQNADPAGGAKAPDTTQPSGVPTDPVVELPRPVAFVFTSGGGRAAAQVGMMTGLRQAGITPDLLIGTSFGAINAAAYAAAAPDDQDETGEALRDLWRRMASDSAFASPGVTIVARLTVRRGKRGTKEVRELIADLVPDDPLESLATTFVPVATDLDTGEAVPLRSGSTREAVLASCAVPILLKPITVGDQTLIDGGFSQGSPVRLARELGAGSIVLLDTAVSFVPEEELPGLRWWEIAATAYDHLMRGQLGHDLPPVAAELPVLTLSTDYGNLFDFSDPEGMFTAGRECADAALASLSDWAAESRRNDVSRPGVYHVPIGFEDYQPLRPLVRLD